MALNVRMRAGLLLALAFVAISDASAGSLRKVWELDLRKGGGAAGIDPNAELPVLALRYSPDGTQIAVVAGTYGKSEGLQSRLLIVDIGNSDPTPTKGTVIARFAMQTSIDETENGLLDSSFQWASNGTLIKVGGTLVRLQTQTTCEVPYLGGMLGPDRILTYDPDAKDFLNHDSSHFLIFDSECRLTGRWTPAEHWFITDRSQDGRLLLIQKELGLGEYEVLVVDAESKAVMGRWPYGQVFASLFADSGQAMCGAGFAARAEHVPVSCWDPRSGKVIGTAPTVNGGMPFAVSGGSSRVVVSDYRRSRIPFTSEYKETLKRRVVWDFRAGKELASWYPDRQEYLDRTVKVPKRRSDLFRFAVSPNGKYVAEGGNGILRILQVVP